MNTVQDDRRGSESKETVEQSQTTWISTELYSRVHEDCVQNPRLASYREVLQISRRTQA